MVLIPMSYWTMTDFDNMLCPFPGAEDLVGLWWREAMAIGASHTAPPSESIAHSNLLVRGWTQGVCRSPPWSAICLASCPIGSTRCCFAAGNISITFEARNKSTACVRH